MRHMIKWLKICALLLLVMLIVHCLEIVYDIMYHTGNGSFFRTEEMHNKHPHSQLWGEKIDKYFTDTQQWVSNNLV